MKESDKASWRRSLIADRCEFPQAVTCDELSSLRDYLNAMGHLLHEAEKDEHETLKLEVEKIPEERRKAFLTWYDPYPWDNVVGSPFRASFTILAFSMMEKQLGLFCRDTGIVAQTLISVGDLRGSMLERARLFLHRLVGFQRPPTLLWDQLANMYEVRNAIVHDGGGIEGTSRAARLVEYLKHAKGLRVSCGFVEIEHDFCTDLFETMKRFFEELHSEQRSLCERVASRVSKITD